MRRSIDLLIISIPYSLSFSIISAPAIPAVPKLTSRSRCHDRPDVKSSKGAITITPPATSTRIYAYGKGSEIWPECNEEPILLSASFPGGRIPLPAKDLLDSSAILSASPSSNQNSAVDALSENSPIQETRGRKRRAVRRTLSHLLQSAASASTRRARSTTSKESEAVYGVPPPAIDKGPAILALALLVTKCVNAKHIGAVVGMSVYFIGLASWCAAPKIGSTDHNPIVNMPSLPSKGHVPNLITNPLGAPLTNSRVYRTWLRVGALFGLLLPTMILAQLSLGSKFPSMLAITEWMNVGNVGEVKRIVGGPLFLLCFQALTEAVARTAFLPLPIRILIPVSYNTLRLSSLHSWAFSQSPSVMPQPLHALGIINLFYWYANLFLFLIPVGVMRYLRAHFFCVEAVEVTVRKGGEGSVGLLP